jgi:hypothetical protein
LHNAAAVTRYAMDNGFLQPDPAAAEPRPQEFSFLRT